MTDTSLTEPNRRLLVEAMAALQQLLGLLGDANDRDFDDGHSVDPWQSDELRAAIERAGVIVERARSAGIAPVSID